MPDPIAPSHRLPLALLAAFVALLAWSGIGPADRTTWWLEVAPAIIGVATLAATYRWFRFTGLVYVLLWLHAASVGEVNLALPLLQALERLVPNLKLVCSTYTSTGRV